MGSKLQLLALGKPPTRLDDDESNAGMEERRDLLSCQDDQYLSYEEKIGSAYSVLRLWGQRDTEDSAFLFRDGIACRGRQPWA